jgi:hypothetical protein
VRREEKERPNLERKEESSRGARGALERTAGGARRREGEAMREKEREGEGEEKEKVSERGEATEAQP